MVEFYYAENIIVSLVCLTVDTDVFLFDEHIIATLLSYTDIAIMFCVLVMCSKEMYKLAWHLLDVYR